MAKFARSRTEVVMNLRAWSARSRIAHLPKIVFLIQTQDPIASDAGTGNPELCRVVIFAENRDPQLVDRQFEFSCQKCPRVIDGFFLKVSTERKISEHLENFSFGEYLKKEAIDHAWTLLTREFKLPIDKLWVTIFREDDDAAKFWISGPGVARDRILRLDEKDNFWQMGDTGPCGPCSEIHYDLGPAASELGHTNCEFPCDCGRYVEIWNLVFMQFDRDSEGQLSPLPKPSIDTGMGLERIASVLQGKISNYDTDLLRPIIDEACQVFNLEYGASSSSDVPLRIIADHVRAATF